METIVLTDRLLMTLMWFSSGWISMAGDGVGKDLQVDVLSSI